MSVCPVNTMKSRDLNNVTLCGREEYQRSENESELVNIVAWLRREKILILIGYN
jgi:hypothetical protein